MSRQEIFNSYNEGGKMRPSSAELSDLHVYIVPPDLWRERYNNLLNQNVTETISAGIIRVHPETRVCNLRDELETQLGAELLPRDFIFLKSVGRSITRLKPKQEFQLKVKHFLPPNSYAPELYLLEVENRDDENETTGSTRPTTRSPQFTESEDERQSNRYRQKPRNATSPYRYTSPLPKIKSDRGGSQKTVESVTHFDQNGDTDGEKLVTVSNSWGGDTRRSPRRSPQTSRRSPPPRSPPPQNDYSHKQNEYPSQQNDYPPPQNDYPDTSRLNASPTHSGVTDKPVASSHQPVASKYDPRSATYTNQTNDSGIAGLTPEEYRENYDDAERRKNEYNESRQKELENRLNGDRMNGDLDDSDRQRRLREDQEREEWERKNRDEDERRRREEEDRRRREEEERQREEDERRRREEEREKMAREKLSGSDEDLNRFPSPPPMNVASTDQDLDSGSQNLTKEQKQAEKKRLLQELEAAREARRAVERQREELVKKAKLMQNKTQNRRNHARDLWKKRYFEEKKRTPPLEEQCNKLRHELDVIHRKLMNALEGSSKDKNTRMENLKPSKQVGLGDPGQNSSVPFGFLSYDGLLVQKQFRRADLSSNEDKISIPPSRGGISSDYGRYDMANAQAKIEKQIKRSNPREQIQSDYGHYNVTKSRESVQKESSVIETLKTANGIPSDQNSSQSDLSTIGKDDLSSLLSDQVSDSTKSIQSDPTHGPKLHLVHGSKPAFSFSPIGSWMNPNKKKRAHFHSKSAKIPSPILSPKSKKRPATKDSGSTSFKSVHFDKAYYY